MEQNLTWIATPLLDWYAQNARPLPWRRDRDPYHVWLSEIMLQQTRVEAVRERYLEFLAAAPDIPALAQLEEDALMALWAGMGYYSRARNLKRAAGVIMEEYGGAFPRDYAQARALPGIGDYTAGAVLSIAFDAPTPAVDGNVLRVLARLRADGQDSTTSAKKKECEALLRPLYPPGRCGDFTQALMELGAVTCLPHGAPRCAACPLAQGCAAHGMGAEEAYPVRPAKRKRRVEKITVFLLRHGERIALRRRPDKGLLAGLWELPNAPGHLDAMQARAYLQELGIIPGEIRGPWADKHIFTHIEWHMHVYEVYCQTAAPGLVWAAPGEEAYGAVPTAFARVLRAASAALSRKTGFPRG